MNASTTTRAIPVTVRSADLLEFTVRFDLDLDGTVYDVSVDVFQDAYDVEIWNADGLSVDVDGFATALGFSSMYSFAEAMTDGAYVGGLHSFELLAKPARTV